MNFGEFILLNVHAFEIFKIHGDLATSLENSDLNASLLEGYFIFIGSRYRILFYHEVQFENDFGEGWDPANIINPATLFMYVPVPKSGA